MSIKLLYILLVICTGLVLGVAAACYWRVRRHMRASADHALRQALQQIEEERKVTRN